MVRIESGLTVLLAFLISLFFKDKRKICKKTDITFDENKVKISKTKPENNYIYKFDKIFASETYM